MIRFTRHLFGFLAFAVLAVPVCVVVAASAQTAHSQERQLPAKLQAYLAKVVHPTATERQALINGEPFTKLLEADASKEVATFGAVWIKAPIPAYVAAIQDIENVEQGDAFRITKRLSSPPRLEDFAELRLPPEDLADLRTCRVGDCELKLGERPLRALQAQVDWNRPDAAMVANDVIRRFAFDYVQGYLQGGDERLAVYRDSSRPRFVAQEFRSMIDAMPSLTTFWPNMRRFLIGFPRVSVPNVTSFLYWQEAQFGLKPTIRINHLAIRVAADETVVASKLLYASHYLWTAVELRVLIPDQARGPGFWLVSVNRSRSDGLSGFAGMLIRGRVRSEALNGALALLTTTKRRLESQ